MTTTHKKSKRLKRLKLGPLAYRRDRDGCDDTWDIYEIRDGGVITSIPFWDCEPAWMQRAEATARLFAASPKLADALDELVTGWPNADADRYHAAVRRAAAILAQAMGRA